MHNMEDIHVTGFQIHAPGDPSVGIFPAYWDLKGDFYFQEQQDLEDFTQALAETFENYAVDDKVEVRTFEQIKEENKYYEDDSRN